MTDVKQFKLPDVGEGLTEADIVSWHVKPGDQVSVNQVIVEIETAKAVVELPCPYDGVVTGLLVQEGQTVDVGTPIIAVDVGGTPGAGEPRAGQERARDGEGGAAATAAEGAVAVPAAESAVEPGLEGSPAPKLERQAVLVGYGVKLGKTTRRSRKRPGTTGGAAPVPAAGRPVPENGLAAGGVTGGVPAVSGANGTTAAQAGIPGTRAPATGTAGTGAPGAQPKPAAKPPVRKLAKDLGVDLALLSGTGPGGRITREDVQAAATGAPARETPAVAAPGEVSAAAPAGMTGGLAGLTRGLAGGPREERIPVRGVRKHTAAAVADSAFTAPHVTEFLQVDMTATMDAIRRIRELPEFAGLRPSPLLLVAKALLVAVGRYPMINSSWDEAAQEIVVKHYVNLGIAAATDRGLLVPNIKNAHLLSLPALAQALSELAAVARQGKAQPADLTGGTISITNVGVFGVDAGTPILTRGEAAILAFGQVRQAPWVHEGELAVREVTTLSMSFDHRIVDGDLGSAVLRDVGAMLADPVRLLAWC